MVKCPRCSKENRKPRSEWFYGPKFDPRRMKVKAYRCSCGASYLAWIRPEHMTVRVISVKKKRQSKVQKSEL